MKASRLKTKLKLKDYVMAAEMFVLFVLMYPTNNFVTILFNNRLKNKST